LWQEPMSSAETLFPTCWKFTSSIFIGHCHESIDTSSMNDWLCRELFIVHWAVFFDEPFEHSFATDATTNWNLEEDLSSKDKALLFETDATTNWNVGVDLSLLMWE
jgi:hypothetical protein